MQRAVLAGRNERQRDRCRENTGEFLLGFLGCFGQALKGLAIPPQIQSMLSLERISNPIHNALIEIIPAQLGVAVGGFDVEHTVRDSKQRHIKSATTEVKHQHATNGAAIKAIGEGGSRGFVEDAFHGDARQSASVAGGLTLSVIEIGRNRNHRCFDGFAQIGAGVIHQFADDAGYQLLRRVFPFRHWTGNTNLTAIIGTNGVGDCKAAVLQFLPVTPDEALEIGERVARAQHQLSSGQLAHQ